MSDIGAEVRIWAFPIAALVIVGAVTWATIGWQVAVLPLVLAAIAVGVLATLNHTRVQAWHDEQLDAQRQTARRLRGLRSAGYAVLRFRTLSSGDDAATEGAGGGTDVDHLVVGPSGVFALTSRRYGRKVPMRAMGHDLLHGPTSQRHVLDQARRGADQVARVIRHSLRQDITVAATVIVHGPDVPWKVLTIRDVNVLSVRRLHRYITRRQRQLSPVEMERVTAAVETAFPASRDGHAETGTLAGTRP